MVATADAAQQAKRIDRDKRRIEAALLAALYGTLGRTKTHARSAYRLGHDPGSAAQQTLAGNLRIPGLGPTLARHMLAANLQGRSRTVKAAQQHTDVDPALLAGLLLLDDEQSELDRYELGVGPLVDRLALRVSAAVATAVVEATRHAASGEAEQPTPEAAISAALATVGVARPTEAAPTGAYSIQQLGEYVVGVGYADGQAAVLEHPDVADTLVGLQYHTMGDSHVRPLHASFDGQVRTAAEWESMGVTPPDWDWQGVPQYGCRCWLVPEWK